MDDKDLAKMESTNDNKQRFPIEVIKKKYIEFSRLHP